MATVTVECISNSSYCYQNLPSEELISELNALHLKVEGIARRCLKSLVTLNSAISTYGIQSGDVAIEMQVLISMKTQFPKMIMQLKSLETAFKITGNKTAFFDFTFWALQGIKATSGLIGLSTSIACFSDTYEGPTNRTLITASCMSWATCAISSFATDLFTKFVDIQSKHANVYKIIHKDLRLFHLLIETTSIAEASISNRGSCNPVSSDDGKPIVRIFITPSNLRRRKRALGKYLDSTSESST